MSYSDAMILLGSAVVARTDKENIMFIGGLIASLGINIQFEVTSVSMIRIVALSVLGYGLGSYLATPHNNKSQ